MRFLHRKFTYDCGGVAKVAYDLQLHESCGYKRQSGEVEYRLGEVLMLAKINKLDINDYIIDEAVRFSDRQGNKSIHGR